MTDIMLLGFYTLQPKRAFCTYIGWDKASAMTDFLLSRYGLEIPLTYQVPDTKELPQDYAWPKRVIVGVLP